MTIIDDNFLKSIGTRLKDLRDKLGLTQEELAIKVNTSSTSIARWERGEKLLDTANLISIADFFNVTADYILHGKELSDDNSFTWYDNFKRLNRLIYSLSLIPYKNTENGNIYFEIWEDEARLYFDKINAHSEQLNYMFENRGEKISFSAKDLDDLFKDFKKYNNQLVPVTLDRFNKKLENHGINPEKYLKDHCEKIKSKRNK